MRAAAAGKAAVRAEEKLESLHQGWRAEILFAGETRGLRKAVGISS